MGGGIKSSMVTKLGRQISPSHNLILAVVIAVCLTAYVCWERSQVFHAIMVAKTGFEPLRDDWPEPLKELLDDPSAIKCDESTIRVYCLCQIDPEFVWKMEAVPGLFEQIEKRWSLAVTNDPRHYVLEGYKSRLSGITTPAWWSPHDDGTTTFFTSPQRPAPQGGNLFQVALDKNHNCIFVHQWFNF